MVLDIGNGPKKICDLTETIPIPRVSLGTDPKLILFPTSWLPVAVYAGAEGVQNPVLFVTSGE